MGLFWSKVANPSLTKDAAGTLGTAIVAAGVNSIQGKLGGHRQNDVKFYYMSGPGGKIVNVLARKIGGIASTIAKEEADKLIRKKASSLKKLINGDVLKSGFNGSAWVQTAALQAEKEIKLYGHLHDVNAYDDFGNVCYESVMLSIPVGVPVTHTIRGFAGNLGVVDGQQRTIHGGSVTNNFLVWYDTVGLVQLSSDKNIVLTQVAGRDYSRKELVSNGDLKFTVTGHITSNLPDCYPTEEVRKFGKIMRYRGIVEVNNPIFGQWGIKYIVITSFNMPTSEGNKSVQDYSFECVGIQPENEIEVDTNDTVSVYDADRSVNIGNKKPDTWIDVLKNVAGGAIDSATDIATQGTALISGMVDEL